MIRLSYRVGSSRGGVGWGLAGWMGMAEAYPGLTWPALAGWFWLALGRDYSGRDSSGWPGLVWSGHSRVG